MGIGRGGGNNGEKVAGTRAKWWAVMMMLRYNFMNKEKMKNEHLMKILIDVQAVNISE